MTVTAFLAFRNEKACLANALRHLTANGVRFFLIDNGSDDCSREVCRRPEFADSLVGIESLAFSGAFDLQRQLETKMRLIESTDTDWVIHLDADEMMHSFRPGETLQAAIQRIDAEGFTAIDFQEFVFLPLENDYVSDLPGFPDIRTYYFFAPAALRLVRAWKKQPGVSMVDSGGHVAVGPELRIAPEKMALRHYMFRSQAHAFSKYSERSFSKDELARGWHQNRVSRAASAFAFPGRGELQVLPDAQSRELSTDRPRVRHYWEWRKPRENRCAHQNAVGEIAVVMATPPGFNPGMLLSEMAAVDFFRSRGLLPAVKFYRFIPLEKRLGHLAESVRERTLRRCDIGLSFHHLGTAASVNGSRLLFWGDYLHMWQYVRAVSGLLGPGRCVEDLLLLASADPRTLSETVSCGTTLLFNSARDLADPAYGPLLARLALNCRLMLVRDMVSAAQLSMLTGRGLEDHLGIDAVQFLSARENWRESWPAGMETTPFEPGGGLLFLGRDRHRRREAAAVVGQLGSALGARFRWLPWGDASAFPLLAEIPALGARQARDDPYPSLGSLVASVASARIVVTDTYHLAVTAWTYGVPAVLLQGHYWPRERDVSAGSWLSRIDKRHAFYSQYGLMDFYLPPDVFEDRERLKATLENIAALVADARIGMRHREVVRTSASRVATKLASALDVPS